MTGRVIINIEGGIDELTAVDRVLHVMSGRFLRDEGGAPYKFNKLTVAKFEDGLRVSGRPSPRGALVYYVYRAEEATR